MKFWSIITDIFSIIGIVFIIFFKPVGLNESKLNISYREIKFQGSFTGGLSPWSPFSLNTATIYEFANNKEIKDTSTIVVFVPDKRGDTNNYKPFLQLLADSGFTVCSTDFFVKDNRWCHNFSDSKYLRQSTLLYQSLLNPQKFTSQREFYTFNIKRELDNLIPILQDLYGSQCKYFLISDSMGDTAIEDFAKQNSEKIAGTFFLDSIPEYLTSGYGCVEQTDPFIACLLGTKRDKSFFRTRYLVLKSVEAIRGL